MTDIIQKDDKNADVLRQNAQTVSEDEITSDKIQSVIADMKEALAKEDDGVALAAPQIGKSLRIFIVAGEVFARRDKKKGRTLEDEYRDKVYINPNIVNTSSDTEEMEEGCLSCRWLYGDVERAKKATVRAYDKNGDEFQEGASGLLSQIFQHETDHLDGVLFLDKAKNVHEARPEKSTKDSASEK